jgi:hypothetical protein
MSTEPEDAARTWTPDDCHTRPLGASQYIAALRSSLDNCRRELTVATGYGQSAAAKRDALAAELAALKRQEPVAWRYSVQSQVLGPSVWCLSETNDTGDAQPLYAAPMPQPAPQEAVREQYDRIINEAWAAVPAPLRVQCSGDATEFHPLIAAVKMLAQPAPAQPQAESADALVQAATDALSWMQGAWGIIDGEWGPCGKTLDQACADGDEPEIAALRAALAAKGAA